MADPLSVALTAALESNPRASVVSLAETLGVSRPTVQERLDRLQAEGQVRVTVSVVAATAAPAAVTALYGLQFTPTARREASEALACMTLAHSVQRLAGRFDFLVAADFPSLRDVAGFADSMLAPLSGLQALETMLSLTMVKSRALGVGNDDDPQPGQHPRSLDEIDRRILRHLAEDGRTSYAEIAKREALPVSTVRKRVTSAEASGAIRFSLVADPALRRLGVQSFIALRVEPAHASAMAEQLRHEVVVERIRTLAHHFNVLALARFPETGSLGAFSERVAALPHVLEIEAWPVLEPLRRLGVGTVPTRSQVRG